MSDISYAMSTRKILFVNDNLEYARNYDFYNIESDANEYGWRWTREVIKEYLNVSERDRLQFYADVYSFKYLVKKVFSAKLDKDKKGRFIGCFEKEQLDAYFKKYPNTLSNQYSHFKVFYDDNGNPKGINELMRVNSSSVFKFKTFYLNQISARIVNGEFLDYNIIDGLSMDEKVNILKNFDNIIYAIERKFYMLSTKKSNGKFLYDDLSQKDKMAIVYNVNKYVQLLQMYCDIVRGFINRYPDVLDNTDILRKINGSLKTVGKNPLLKFLNCEVHIDLIHLNPIKRGK